MVRLKQQLEGAAVQAADDDFYDLHPEMVLNGARQPIDSDDPEQSSLRDLWTYLYIAHGGAVEKHRSAGPDRETYFSDFEVEWLPNEKYIRFQEGPQTGKSIVAVKAHVYFARASRLLVADRWPLSEYYVYIDTELSETIDFDTLGLLWTDEKGFPHFCGGDGKPQERVEFFPFSYSTQAAHGASCVLIYDTDLHRLKKKRASLQGKSGRHSPHRVKELYISDLGTGLLTSDIKVPVDDEVLPYDEIVLLVKECDLAMEKAHQAGAALKRFIEKPEHQGIWLYEDAIKGWLAVGDRRNYLTRLDSTRTTWDVCPYRKPRSV
jgi:hypothetical protein